MPDRPAPLTAPEMFDRGDCQWIEGDTHDNPTFCAEAQHVVTRNGKPKRLPYCAAHAARAYRKPPRTPGGVDEGVAA